METQKQQDLIRAARVNMRAIADLSSNQLQARTSRAQVRNLALEAIAYLSDAVEPKPDCCHAIINGQPRGGTLIRTGPGMTPGSADSYQCDTCGPIAIEARKKAHDTVVLDTSTVLETFSSGASSTRRPRLDLVWYSAIEAIARRCENGIEVHGEGSVNGLTPPGDPGMTDTGFLRTRASHAIGHLYRVIQKLNQGIPLDEEVDDPAAIVWAGALLCEACIELKRKQVPSAGTGDQRPVTG